jgi:serine/threonine protein kinase
MIGMEIGSYRIIEKLGEGGMGVVYKALDTSLDRPVAMKVLSSDFSRNPELVERFRAEARAQANLNHTNLATLYSFLLHEGDAFMVMEYIEGETFEHMIRRRGPIPDSDAVPLFKQALLGIGYAHRCGIIHRDIKPSNLMLNKHGIVKVMDFGIAKVMGARSMTRTGTQMGTVAYMSPEQIQNRPVDIRTDIYALGITLYELLSGHLPFDSDSDFKVMQDHVATPPPLPTRFYPYIPKGLENVVLKALEKDPDARYQSVEEFGAALEHPESLAQVPSVAAQQTVPAATRGTVLETPIGTGAPAAASHFPPPAAPQTAPTPLPLPSPKPGGSNPNQNLMLAGAGVLVLALVVFGIYKAFSPKPHPPAVAPAAQNATESPTDSGGQNGQIQIDTGTPVAATPNSQSAPSATAKTAPLRTRQPNQQQNTTPPPSNDVAPPAQSVTVTIPAGATVSVTMIDAIDSDSSSPGQNFHASIAAPVMVGNQAPVYQGADARVRLEKVQLPGHFGGHSELQVHLVSFNARGTIYTVASDLVDPKGSSSGKNIAAKVGVGAAIGGILSKGKGAAMGAVGLDNP